MSKILMGHFVIWVGVSRACDFRGLAHIGLKTGLLHPSVGGFSKNLRFDINAKTIYLIFCHGTKAAKRGL